MCTTCNNAKLGAQMPKKKENWANDEAERKLTSKKENDGCEVWACLTGCIKAQARLIN